MVGMTRFGRGKKTPKLPETNHADPEMLSLPPTSDPPQAPRVSLPHVETQLNMHQYNGLFNEISTPERPNGAPPPPSSPDPALSTSPSSTNGFANFPNQDTSATEWSSAVGHAATGKSGRVIHNLQEEVARLTRECSLYRSRAEETQRMNDAYKVQAENMTERLRNLEQANETNRHSIARKDKKIEELRAEVQAEKDRRVRAEGEAKKVNQMMGVAQDDFHRKCAELQEITNHSRTQYDILAKSAHRERAEQQRKLKSIKDDISTMKKQFDDKNSKLGRLDAILAEKDQELELARERFDALYANFKTYKRAHDEEVRALIESGRQSDTNIDAALASLKETEGKMRWVMQLKEQVKDTR
ncbi:uncharacterized protein BP01DRAFT_182588 [Aspergillus saccharolyticus JOP 1030-1]|uniref:SWI5-dependent HO expression protein 3 n=1 Tax=Aspergillus saccharolyticus JOP 1030-1 TaxID=1450539 RepID=A0A318ZCH8_9EURO|nr:hypothetical protein BP01DRAFT_182588 [Aspergillus saccharolyticus JOP 1030-1]PYH41210.1 hypothetical protein BP01DRAFT_182588 [Aspergillus saccharolyticus JOP 1030-1]